MNDWERAAAAADAIWDAHPLAIIHVVREWDSVTVWVTESDDPSALLSYGTGANVIAALLDLGAKLDESHD